MKQLFKPATTLFLFLGLLLLSGCSSTSAKNWLFNHLANPTTPIPVETTFSVNVTPSSGDPSFIFNALRNQEEIELYGVVLDITNVSSGSLMQIRQFSGTRTGRVVFQIVEDGQGNLQGKYSINPETHVVTFSFTYENETFAGQTQFTGSRIINLTAYLYSTLKGIPVITNTPPSAVIMPVQVSSQAGSSVSVSLDGSGSSDEDGDPLSYSWALVPPEGSLSSLNNANSVNPSFEADVPGIYQLSLVVNDGKVDSELVSVSIELKSANDVAVSSVEQLISSISQLPYLNEDGSANFATQNGQKQILQQLQLVTKMIQMKNYDTALMKVEQQLKHARGLALSLIEEAAELLRLKLPESNGATGEEDWISN